MQTTSGRKSLDIGPSAQSAGTLRSPLFTMRNGAKVCTRSGAPFSRPRDHEAVSHDVASDRTNPPVGALCGRSQPKYNSASNTPIANHNDSVLRKRFPSVAVNSYVTNTRLPFLTT